MRRLTFLLTLLALACQHRNVPLPNLDALNTINDSELVARGEYIVRYAADCSGCHTSERGNPDAPMAGGAEFKDWRLGTVRAANITPDSATGLGTWTDEEIVRALRSGVRQDGRLLAPVMPYKWLHGMSDRDALAVARYLRTLQPVRNEVRQGTNIVYWFAKTFVLGPLPTVSVQHPQENVTAVYGGYLANNVAICAHCHTPRGGINDSYDMRRSYAGDESPAGGFPANPANITPDSATGIGAWSEADFVRTLRTGVNPKGDSLHPIMPWRALQHMTENDLRAIYRYLRTVPAVHHVVPRRPQ